MKCAMFGKVQFAVFSTVQCAVYSTVHCAVFSTVQCAVQRVVVAGQGSSAANSCDRGGVVASRGMCSALCSAVCSTREVQYAVLFADHG